MSLSASPVISASPSRAATLAVPVFVGTIFFSAFLLFGIQPMFTKMVLPRLGGSPAVWSVAMVFFQAMLLAGYGYAHVLVSRLGVRQAALVHLTLMAVVIAIALPIGIAAGYERPPQTGESLWVMLLFVTSVGLPFFAVSANGPLLQAWFAKSGHPQAHDPYFLYAASNIGSFLALIAYPFAIEPFLPLSMQARSWTWGFALLLAAIAACAGIVIGRKGDVGSAAPVQPDEVAAPVPAATRAAWVGYAFVPSALLVAVTAHISTDVAAAPLLWVIPLALFLLTFTIVFQRRPLLSHALMLRIHYVIFFPALVVVASHQLMEWWLALLVHLTIFFITAMVAHGELVKRRPPAEKLTEFYFWMSFGGVLGGLFAGLLAPAIFSTVAEYPLLLIAGFACRPDILRAKSNLLQRSILPFICAVICIIILTGDFQSQNSFRSFFGVNRVTYSPDKAYRILAHGTTIHGAQRILNDDGTAFTAHPEPLTYYFRGGAIASAIDGTRTVFGGKFDRVAAVGLGTGSLACHVKPGEAWSFYEIDSKVVEIARNPKFFRFLSECAPTSHVVVGDARLTLADAADHSLDLIVVDAFSSDAIPSHLMTVEAMGIYLQKLTSRGVILFHISNRNMELAPIVAAIGASQGLKTIVRQDPDSIASLAKYQAKSYVAVVTKTNEHIDQLLSLPHWQLRQPDPKVKPWTDDYADIIGAILRKMRN
jgi:spermidine synthase